MSRTRGSVQEPVGCVFSKHPDQKPELSLLPAPLHGTLAINLMLGHEGSCNVVSHSVWLVTQSTRNLKVQTLLHTPGGWYLGDSCMIVRGTTGPAVECKLAAQLEPIPEKRVAERYRACGQDLHQGFISQCPFKSTKTPAKSFLATV